MVTFVLFKDAAKQFKYCHGSNAFWNKYVTEKLSTLADKWHRLITDLAREL